MAMVAPGLVIAIAEPGGILYDTRPTGNSYAIPWRRYNSPMVRGRGQGPSPVLRPCSGWRASPYLQAGSAFIGECWDWLKTASAMPRVIRN
jgi:hypothetical protein